MVMDREKTSVEVSMSSNSPDLDPQSDVALAVTYRLKHQIDQLFKLVNRQNVCLKRTNRFRNYLKTLVTTDTIDTEKLDCELSKYEQNYSLCWKRCRKLNRKLLGRSRTSTKADTAALYDTLYDLLQCLTVATDVPQTQEANTLTETQEAKPQNEEISMNVLYYCQVRGCKTLHKTNEDLSNHMRVHANKDGQRLSATKIILSTLGAESNVDNNSELTTGESINPAEVKKISKIIVIRNSGTNSQPVDSATRAMCQHSYAKRAPEVMVAENDKSIKDYTRIPAKASSSSNSVTIDSMLDNFASAFVLPYQFCNCETIHQSKDDSLIHTLDNSTSTTATKKLAEKKDVRRLANLKASNMRVAKSTHGSRSRNQARKNNSAKGAMNNSNSLNETSASGTGASDITKLTVNKAHKKIAKSLVVMEKSKETSTGSTAEQRLIRNQKRRSLPKNLKCEVEGCTYAAQLPYLMKQHMRAHSDERPFKCKVEGCGLSFKTAHTLKTHQSTHRTDRPFKCKLCDKYFKSPELVYAHLRVHSTIRYPCEYEGCQNKYKNQKELLKHIRIVHTKEAPLLHCEWPDCKFSTYRQETLSIHKKVHTDERPYLCIWPDCEKAFKTSGGLSAHKLMHQNERRHKCRWTGCNYSCNLLGNLHKHEAIHERKQAKGIFTG